MQRQEASARTMPAKDAHVPFCRPLQAAFAGTYLSGPWLWVILQVMCKLTDLAEEERDRGQRRACQSFVQVGISWRAPLAETPQSAEMSYRHPPVSVQVRLLQPCCVGVRNSASRMR